MGIGFTAIRDIVSFLRYATKDNPLAQPERSRIRNSLGFGISPERPRASRFGTSRVQPPSVADASS
jgi:hypothetical protein